MADIECRERLILNYFQAWIDKKTEVIEATFSEDAVYSECYGPEYHGMAQLLSWFADWNKLGNVLKWDIKQFFHCGTVTVVEWYFEYDYNNEVGGFDGVSIVTFNEDGKIINLKEFQSKAEHIYPYGR